MGVEGVAGVVNPKDARTRELTLAREAAGVVATDGFAGHMAGSHRLHHDMERDGSKGAVQASRRRVQGAAAAF